MVVQFNRDIRAQPRPPTAQPPQYARIRGMIDRYQVLALTRPLVAAWLLDFVDNLLNRFGV